MKTYKWYGVSNDRSFEARGANFGSFRGCRREMEIAALEKMTWNTTLDDFTDGTDEIGYQVKFKKDMIAQLSYSGKYVFIILDADEERANMELVDRMIQEHQYAESDREMAYRGDLYSNLAIYANNQQFGWGE